MHPPRPPPQLPPPGIAAPRPRTCPYTPLEFLTPRRKEGEGRDAPERAERGEGAAGLRGEGSSAGLRATPPTSGGTSGGAEAGPG